MKKTIFILSGILMLTGCTQPTAEPETAETQTITEQTTEQISERPTLPEVPASEPSTVQTTEEPAPPEEKSALIVIDPGHQAHGNSAQEPIGPGASETKAKVSDGTAGHVSGLAEYELNLIISNKLRDMLEQRGYTVIMTRETHDVDISNSERAAIANNAHADAFVRIHADGSEDTSLQGAMTICQTPQNPYNGDIYPQSSALAECVLDCIVAETGAKRRNVWETDTMSGINWASVPATIVEVGYMSNPEEDAKLGTDEYQTKLAKGIANGIEKYLNERR